jgi:putative autoinducer-2 (AI-2) aldolase
MPDAEELKEGKAYYSDTPQRAEGFFLKGSNSLEWGMKDRLARIFNPVSGNTVMLAFDHPDIQSGIGQHGDAGL